MKVRRREVCCCCILTKSALTQVAGCISSTVVEKGDTRTKIEALKKVIQMILNGEKMSSLLMAVIRFVMPMQDHTVKKLLLVFWEVVPKYHPDGKLMQEMILVCDAYRKVGLLSKVSVGWLAPLTVIRHCLSPLAVAYFLLRWKALTLHL